MRIITFTIIIIIVIITFTIIIIIVIITISIIITVIVSGSLAPRIDINQSPVSGSKRSPHSHSLFPGRSAHGDPDKRTAPANTGMFLPKPEALSILKRDLSIRGTITCECCIHRCDIMELRQYCSVPNPNLTMKRNLPANPEPLSVIKERLDLVEKQKIGHRLLHPIEIRKEKRSELGRDLLWAD